MQKKIIALAVAALASGAALAQSNVTIYGVVDAGVARYSGDDVKTSSQVINSGLTTSRLGFKGVEDLGNGLKALFVLEYRLTNDNNNGIGGSYLSAASASGPARQQLLGLTGAFGTVAAGRLQTTAFDWAVKYQALAATAFDAANMVTSKGGFRVNTGVDVRADNALAYISPNIGGFTFAYNHAEAGEQATGVAAIGRTTANLFSADYTNGPLAVGLVYDRAVGTGTVTTVDQADWALGSSYDFGVAKLMATYQTTKNKVAGAANDTNKAWHLGVAVPVSAAGAVVASYAKNSINTTTVNDNAKAWNVAYTHALSKRTKLYAGYAHASNGNDAGLAGNANQVGYGIGAGVTNGSTSVIATGVAHSF